MVSQSCFQLISTVVRRASFLMIFSFICCIANTQTLQRGDIAVVGVSANTSACGGIPTGDEISFVCFKDITTGTTFDLTDNGWERQFPGLWGDNEGTIRFTRTGGTIAKGTVITYHLTNNNGTGAYAVISPDGNWQIDYINNPPIGAFALNMNAGGDQLYFMAGGTWNNQGMGGDHNATYDGDILFGFNTLPVWAANGSSQQSNLHPDVTPCFHMEPGSQSDFLKYTGPMTPATQLQWIQRIRNAANWSGFPTCAAYNSAPPIYPTPVVLPILPSGMSISCNANCTGCAPLTTTLTFNLPTSGGPFNVVYTNGVSNFTLNNATNGQTVSATVSSTTTYSLVSVTDQQGCPVYSNFDGQATLTVSSPPNLAGVGSNSPICEGGTVQFSAPTIPGGFYQWTGPLGFNSNLEDPTIPNATTGMSGTYTLVVSANGCTSNPVNVNLNVLPAPQAFSTTLNGCGPGGIANFNLTAVNNIVNGNTGNPVNWYFNANGTNPIPNPASFTTGSTTVYAQVSSGGCLSAVVPVTIVVDAPQTPNLGTASLCQSAGTYNLTNLLDPNFPNGTWSGPGVSGNTFNPAGQSGSVLLTFTPSAPCTNPGTTTITVSVPTTPAISGVPASVCQNDSPVALPTTQSGITGTWSGPGVSGNTFNPAGQSGSVTLTFTPNAGQCANPANANISVGLPTTPTLSGVPASVCQNEAPVALPTTQSGITGTWSGAGVSGNTFNPAGQSGNVTLTFTPTAGQCASPATTVIDVSVPVTPSISGVPAAVCQNDSPVVLPTTQSGLTGTWSGAGVSSNTFNPAGQSGSVVLTFTPSAPCTNPATTTITVNVPTTPAISGVPASVCQNESPVVLPTTQSGVTGTWSGAGVSGNTFNPAGQSGSVVLTFTPSAGQCANPATTNVTVNVPSPPAISGVPAAVCQNESPVVLPTTQSGITGNWSGAGVSGNTFNPAGQSGSVTLTFTPSVGQCGNSTTTSISVGLPTTPVISGVPASVCQNDSPVALPSLQSGINGNWSGTGVSSNTFNPAGLNGNITLTFTPSAGACANPATAVILVNLPVIPAIAGVPALICQNDQPIGLPTTQSGITGTWSGAGVSSNSFDPAGQSGAVTLTFTPSPGQCANVAVTTILVNVPVTPTISGVPASVCQSAAPVALPATQSGITGTWSGPGVSSNLFNPAGQSGVVTLTFTPSPGLCANAATAAITVNVPVTPPISGVPASICQNSTPVALPTTQGGYSGNWSGPGVGVNIFNPAGQSGTVVLTFTPSAGQCANVAMAAVAVPAAPSFTNLSVNCDNPSQTYTVSFTITGGAPGSYTVNGVPTGANFVSSPLTSGTTYIFNIDDANGCGPVTLTGTANCSCTTYAGTMNFSGGTQQVCVGQSFTVIHNGNQTLDPDDVLQFVLHTGAGATLGTVISTSNSTTFPYPAGVVLGQTYYVSPVAGTNDGTGNPDLTDGCLSVTQGVPVVFYQPSVQFSGGGAVCAGQCFNLGIQFGGVPPFSLSLVVSGSGLPPVTVPLSSSSANLDFQICPADYGITSGTLTLTASSLADANCPANLSPVPFVALTVVPTAVGSFTPTVCTGGSVTVNGVTFNAGNPSGSVLIAGGSYTGCDSLVNVSLSFYPPVVYSLNQTLCAGGSLVVNGTLYNAANPSGTEVIAGGSYLGCDSTIQVNLSFNTAVVNNLSPTLCPGGSLTVNGVVYDQANPTGSQTISGGSYMGCDSTINVNLSFYQPAVFNLNQTLCQGGSITVNGTVYNEANPSGTEVMPGAGFQGCDSIVHVDLSFNSAVITNLSPALCPGASLLVNGVVYNQNNPSGTETIVGGSYLGCDSIINVTLLYYPPAVFNLNQTLCPGGSLMVGGVLFNQGNPGGTLTLAGGSYTGCDSVINVSLAFFPPAVSTLNQTLCPGGSVTVNGVVYNQGNPVGMQIIQGGSYAGCDSTVNVNLSFYQPAVFNLNQTLCPGGSLSVNGVVYDQSNPSGMQVIAGGNYAGCDSTVNVNLSFYSPAVFNLNQTLCTGGSITVNGTVYDATNPSGTEVIAGGSSNGCDSTIQVNLSFGPAVINNLSPTLCPGGSLTVNGVVYDQSNPAGVQTIAGGSYLGCDSVVNVNLAFYPPAVSTLSQTLCPGGSLTVNGVVYDQSNPAGVQTIAGGGYLGCDSVVNVNLAFYPPAVSTLSQTLCPGGSLTVNGVVYDQSNPAGVQTIAGGSYLGCDSVVNVSLAFYPPAVSTLSQTLCPGGSLTVNGVVYDQSNPAGVQTIAGGSYLGCDSVVNVNLAFYPPAVSTLSQTLCPGGSLTVNGVVYDQSNPAGVQTIAGGSYLGCDSVVNVSLAFYPPAVSTLGQTLCPGGSLTVNGVVYDQSNPAGVQTIAGGSYLGCDSVVNVNLAFYPPAVSTLSQTLCPGGSLTVNGVVYDQSNPTGVQTIAGGSYLGCDSTVNVNLSFGNEIVVSLSPTLCPGEFIYINGTLYYSGNTTGTETFAGGSYLGCDSTVNVSLSFYPEAIGYLDTNLLAGQSIVVNGTVYGSNKTTGVEVFPDGSYTGCDSMLFVSVSFFGVITADVQLTSPTCYGDKDGVITVTGISGGVPPYVIALNGSNSMVVNSFPVVYGNLDAGFHQLTVQDNTGALTVQEVILPAPEKLVVELGEDLTVSLGESVTLSAEASFVIHTWNWSPDTYLDCTGCPSPTVGVPIDDITYTLEVTDLKGCTAQDKVTVLVQKVRQVYVPNVFSPNFDGINDELVVFAGAQVAKVKVFKVFNRWGGLMFEHYNFPPNDPLYGWDGRFQGENMNTGVYVWYAEVEFLDGHREIFEGGVTLLR